MTEAWGVLFHEDWHWMRIGWVLALAFFTAVLDAMGNVKRGNSW
jgi:hypothetical protein